MRLLVCAWILSAVVIITAGSTPAGAADQDRACTTARSYIDLVQHGNFDEIVKLFAANAVFFTPTGKVLHGSAEIGEFYKTTVSAVSPIVRTQNFVGDAHDCYFEIWTKSKRNADGIYVPDPDGDFVRGAIDHFTVDDQGRVVQLVAFSSPTARVFK